MTEQVLLRARHFKDATYISTDCAMARAVKEQFNTTTQKIAAEWGHIDGKPIEFYYGSRMFDEDKQKADELKYSDEVVRTVEVLFTSVE